VEMKFTRLHRKPIEVNGSSSRSSGGRIWPVLDSVEVKKHVIQQRPHRHELAQDHTPAQGPTTSKSRTIGQQIELAASRQPENPAYRMSRSR